MNMRRLIGAVLAVGVLAAVLAVAVVADRPPPPPPDVSPVEVSDAGASTELLRQERDHLVQGWRALPGKTPTLEYVPDLGGLWRSEVPFDAGGVLRTVPGSQEAPRAAERVATVRVEVEAGLGVDGAEFARQVMHILNDPRGWGHDGSVAFAQTDGEADIDVTLASPATTDMLCHPVDTGGTVSCGRVGFAVLNAARWAQGAEPFLEAGGSIEEYRRYLVNHEVGHVLGHGHVDCPAPDAVAPVMLQQTLGLEGCRPNGWPAEGG